MSVKDENTCNNKFNEHTNMSISPKSSSRIKEVIQHKMKAEAEAEEKSAVLREAYKSHCRSQSVHTPLFKIN